MLPLDHLPFPTPDLEGLAEGFRRLGFTVSPGGRYSDLEGGVFPNRCVFTRRGWFDLLQADGAPDQVRPQACLFLTHDLEAARQSLADLEPSRRTFHLERRWDEDVGRPPERFRWMGLKSPRLDVQAAVIEHAWPCVDLLPQWLDQPNGAIEVLGLALAGDPPAETGLDTSGFRFLLAAQLREAYGADCVVRIRVADLAHPDAALTAHGVEWSTIGSSLVVRPMAPFDCAFEFVTVDAPAA